MTLGAHYILLTRISHSSPSPTSNIPDWTTFFISQIDLSFLTKATIEPMILSDHNPITMTIQIPYARVASHIWRLDSSLLTDSEITQSVSQNLAQYFSENVQGDSPPEVIWAAHKCVIRGTLISLAAKRNKRKKAKIVELTNRIYTLEQKHKASLATEALAELTRTREELLEELHKTLKLKYTLSQKYFYEFGNKSGKLLARALQAKKAAQTIHTIKDTSGTAIVKFRGNN